MSPKALGMGQSAELIVTFELTSGSANVFNPFFRSDLPLPARIVVFDEDQRYLTDLLVSRSMPPTPPASAWVRADGMLGCVVTVYGVDNVPEASSDSLNRPTRHVAYLKPGRWFLQAIYTQRLLAIDPATGYKKFYFPGMDSDTELCRSNVLELRVPRKGDD